MSCPLCGREHAEETHRAIVAYNNHLAGCGYCRKYNPATDESGRNCETGDALFFAIPQDGFQLTEKSLDLLAKHEP